jgi:hypothetical protein
MSARRVMGTLLMGLLGLSAWLQANEQKGRPSPSAPAQVQTSTATVNLTIPGQTRWLDTGIELAMRQVIHISVEGNIQWNKDGHQMCGPTGAVPYTRWGHKPILGINTGALIGKIGADSTEYFYIGAGQQVVAFASGRLFLGINDDNVLDNDGAFQVLIRAVK